MTRATGAHRGPNIQAVRNMRKKTVKMVVRKVACARNVTYISVVAAATVVLKKRVSTLAVQAAYQTPNRSRPCVS